MKKITITRNTVCDGQDVLVGQTVNASERDARILLAMGKAVPARLQNREQEGDDEQVEIDRLRAEAIDLWEASEELQDQYPDVEGYLATMLP